MRTILGVLRDEHEDRVPHPGLGQLDELAARTREAGLDVELDAPAPVPPVPSAVGSAVYRIVQEALTNVLRHVGPTGSRSRSIATRTPSAYASSTRAAVRAARPPG